MEAQEPQQQQAAVLAGEDASVFAVVPGQVQTNCGIPATAVMMAVRNTLQFRKVFDTYRICSCLHYPP
jgi:hypothetical protein